MKFAALLLAPILCIASASPASDSAYQALRVVSAERGQEVLNHVIEVTGRNGVPEPVRWKIVFDEPTARGGVRELEVTKGKVVAERTPVRAYGGSAAGAVMDFTKLNLDSEGVFTVVEKEARKARIGFDSIDYTLLNSDTGNAPIWSVNLLDGRGRTVGSMQIAADTGAIMRSDLYGRPGESPAPEPSPGVTTETTSSDTEGTDEHGLRIGHKIKTGILKAGGALQNFFTGHRSLDR